NTALDDPMKNFSRVIVKPFTSMNISGGNGYAIEIRQGNNYDIMLMNSRKSFFRMKESGDTLTINFSVANQTYQLPQSCITGLVITVPKLMSLHLSGTNNIIGPFAQDSLNLFQDSRTFTRMRQGTFTKLSIDATQESTIDMERGNTATAFLLRLKNKASLTMNGISVEKFIPIVKDSARLIFFGKSFDQLKGNY
ncbi:MAG: hypothetical protein ABI151_17085, partial [Chitinophagaceae bacterium]